jgi:hypothetical protein
MTDLTVDRAAIRRMVEDFWRSLVLYGRHLGETRPNISNEEAARLCLEFSRRFQAQNEATAASTAPDQARLFLQTIDEEDTICSEEGLASIILIPKCRRRNP